MRVKDIFHFDKKDGRGFHLYEYYNGNQDSMRFWVKNTDLYDSLKDFIFNWYISKKRAYIDSDVLEMIRHIDQMRYLMNTNNCRSGEIERLIQLEENACKALLKGKNNNELQVDLNALRTNYNLRHLF